MKFVEIVVGLNKAVDVSVDLIIAQLSELGFEGFWEEEDKLMAYIPENIYTPLLLNNCPFLKNIKSAVTFNKNIIDDVNWNEIWESNFELVVIKNCCIRAPFHAKPSENDIKYDIIIEPKMSFGTGHHETTSMVVDMMLELDFDGKKVLDMGCGTAVLAILAAMKNAAIIDAVDNDIWSYNNALENSERNDVDFINVIHGDIEKVKQHTYDVILANITRNILMDFIPSFSLMQKTNDVLILSGFLSSDMSSLEKFAYMHSYKLKKSLIKNNWAALELYKL